VNGYSIFAVVVMIPFYVLFAMFPRLAHRIYGGMIFVMFWLGSSYFIFIFMRLAMKNNDYASNRWDFPVRYFKNSIFYFVKIYMLVPLSSLGLLINVLYSRRRLEAIIGFAISSVLFVGWIVVIGFFTFGENKVQI
jgi:hypothetical protein